MPAGEAPARGGLRRRGPLIIMIISIIVIIMITTNVTGTITYIHISMYICIYAVLS